MISRTKMKQLCELIHSDERLYGCKICKIKFNHLGTAHRHITTWENTWRWRRIGDWIFWQIGPYTDCNINSAYYCQQYIAVIPMLWGKGKSEMVCYWRVQFLTATMLSCLIVTTVTTSYFNFMQFTNIFVWSLFDLNNENNYYQRNSLVQQFICYTVDAILYISSDFNIHMQLQMHCIIICLTNVVNRWLLFLRILDLVNFSRVPFI